MKVGILTHYSVYNQGAQLQMYGLKYWLEEHGHTVYILTYEKNFDFNENEKKKNSGSVQNMLYYAHEYLIKKGIGLSAFNVGKVRAIKKDFQQVRTIPYDRSECDVIIVGSDEVFSVDVGCNKMMYGYGMGTIPIIAYAPSFGRTTQEILKKYNCFELVRDGLANNFAELSARDFHTQKMIRSLTGKTVPLVCDPVILYQGSKFYVPVRNISGRYLLIYSYDRNLTDRREIREIRKYAKANRLITVSVGTYHGWCDKNIVCNAHQWVSYFKGAEAVLTDTFHGTVAAIKNHCNTAVYVRKSINTFKLKSLLRTVGMEDRELKSITAENIEKILSKKIDYQAVEEEMAGMIRESEEYLKNSLESV